MILDIMFPRSQNGCLGGKSFVCRNLGKEVIILQNIKLYVIVEFSIFDEVYSPLSSIYANMRKAGYLSQLSLYRICFCCLLK